MPAKAGIWLGQRSMDSRFRGSDGLGTFETLAETIAISPIKVNARTHRIPVLLDSPS